ncbi:DUF4253 domain-containing protein [Micromonospora sp. NPDC050397]|uniref:DUF4253 domain-containing protein n=1 Tax=Micromonospora sp. NPDC050397 TaxID=3364279 RepID=UPI00384D00D9
MTTSTPPRPELHRLFPGGTAATAGELPVRLPPGRLVEPEQGGHPAYWLGDGPASAEVWGRLHAEHGRTGLWPLLLGGLDLEPDRPWADGEVWPEDPTAIDRHDPAVLLAQWWSEHVRPDDGDPEQKERSPTAPYGPAWPGRADRGTASWDPGEHARKWVGVLADDGWRLGLVAAGRGADALTVSGWGGPANYAATSEVSAVVRDWEDRFAARVVAVGFDALYLSVAAPPLEPEHALRVAAEHFAFCPDNVWQGADTLRAYADLLLGAPIWSFWWD